MTIQPRLCASDRAARAATTSLSATARRTSRHRMKARFRGSAIRMDATARSPERPVTNHLAPPLCSTASRSTVIVYRLASSTAVTSTRAAKSSAVGGDGMPPIFSRRAEPPAMSLDPGVAAMAAPSWREDLWREDRQLGGILSQTGGEIGFRQPLQGAIILEIVNQLVEHGQVRRSLVDQAAPFLAHVIASGHLKRAMRLLGPRQDGGRVIERGVHLAGRQRREHRRRLRKDPGSLNGFDVIHHIVERGGALFDGKTQLF